MAKKKRPKDKQELIDRGMHIGIDPVDGLNGVLYTACGEQLELEYCWTENTPPSEIYTKDLCTSCSNTWRTRMRVAFKKWVQQKWEREGPKNIREAIKVNNDEILTHNGQALTNDIVKLFMQKMMTLEEKINGVVDPLVDQRREYLKELLVEISKRMAHKQHPKDLDACISYAEAMVGRLVVNEE